MSRLSVCLACVVACTACGDTSGGGGGGAGSQAPLGVVFTSPAPGQLDVPVGTRIVVAFSTPVDATALGTCTASGSGATGGVCLVGPSGVVDAPAQLAGSDGLAVEISSAPLAPGATYGVYVAAAVAPGAANLPTSGPLFSFTTRATRPRAAIPSVIALEGSDPAHVGARRPLFETSTIHVTFSEPMEPTTLLATQGSVELVAQSDGAAVPVRLYTDGIHLAIDPVDDLTGGASYELRLGAQIHDTGGQALAPVMFELQPLASRGSGATPQVLRTWQPGDPGPASSRSGATRNAIVMDKPLIGRETTLLQASTLATELGDPTALADLGGPIAFTIRRGQRLTASGLDLKLGGQIAAGLSTGDVHIELLTDGGGRLYRNPWLSPDQVPDNTRAPLYVDLVLDLAVSATDPTGNAALSQTVLGVEATGTVDADRGVLAIETVSSMELGLLGVTVAPTNLVLELITDPAAQAAVDREPPALVSAPGQGAVGQGVADGMNLLFSEPVDVTRLRNGGLTLTDDGGDVLPVVIESSGAAVVVHPLGGLAYSTTYSLELTDVADVAGNAMAATTIMVTTPPLDTTNVPLTATAVHPGVACALTGATAGSPGRCSGGLGTDDLYAPFTLPANEDLSVVFSQPVTPATITHAAQCNAGSVRVEQVDDSGACIAAVPGTYFVRDRGVGFTPDVPWTIGAHYRLTLVSGGNKSCDAGELCGISGDAASFDPLAGAADDGAAGGPNLVMSFDAVAASGATFMVANALPASDVNGDGAIDTDEALAAANAAGMAITGTGGAIGDASFTGPDCVPDLDGTQNCMYLTGAMPVEMGELATNCPLPDGTMAPACIPVTMFPEAMYGTSLALSASIGFSIDTDTLENVMRVREPAGGGPVMGYIVAGDGGGAAGPKLVTQLSLYMDAPDMSVPLSDHDLHSKPLAVSLAGPVGFLPDGRIAIALANVADVPVTVNISAPLGVDGSVDMVLPAGQMKLQLVSPPVRGGER